MKKPNTGVFPRSLICSIVLFFIVGLQEAGAQDMRKMDVVYSPAGMNDVQVKRNMAYKATDQDSLSMDLYYPSDVKENSKLPVVIFALGYSGYGLKYTQQYISWGKLAALNGMVGINYETSRPESDLTDLINFIQKNADELNIDKERIGIWSCSGNVPVALSYLADYEGDFLKFGVFYYGVMSTPDRRYHSEIDSLSKKFGFKFPHLDNNDRLPPELPLLVVRAGRDETSHINKTIDHFLFSALSDNMPVTFINYQKGQHAFDILNDNQASRKIIKQTLSFMQENLSSK